MIVNAESIPRDALPRSERPPRFDFVESASRKGTAYQFDGGGHFVVAPDDSLLPRFVVELSLATLGDVDYYNAVIQALNEHSNGFMWFDDHDLHSFDLTWRMRLPVIAVSALFELKLDAAPPERPGFRLGPVGADVDRGHLSMLLTTLPPRMGGLTLNHASSLLERGDVTVATNEGSPVGVVVSSKLPTGDVYAHAFAVAPEFQGMGVGSWFMHSFAAQVAKGRSVIFGMPNNSHAEFRGAMKLGARIVNRGWRAQLGSI